MKIRTGFSAVLQHFSAHGCSLSWWGDDSASRAETYRRRWHRPGMCHEPAKRGCGAHAWSLTFMCLYLLHLEQMGVLQTHPYSSSLMTVWNNENIALNMPLALCGWIITANLFLKKKKKALSRVWKHVDFSWLSSGIERLCGKLVRTDFFLLGGY